MYEIEKVSNGYLITNKWNCRFIYQTLEEVFEALLLHFEGRASTFSGESYGRVVIERQARKKSYKGRRK